jgi:hypothetical protein
VVIIEPPCEYSLPNVNKPIWFTTSITVLTKSFIMKEPFILIALSIALLQGCNQNSKKDLQQISDTSGREAELPAFALNKIQMDGELPAKQFVPSLFDEMDYQQAVQCYLWALPLVEIESMKAVQEKTFGATDNDLVLYNSYEDKLGLITANATTPYIMAFIDLSNTGPFVLEIPGGAIAGGVSDCWQRGFLVFGEVGESRGKYLLIPPGSVSVKVPGYRTTPCPTMTLWLGIRALDADPEKAKALIHGVKMYSYRQRAHPPITRIVSPEGRKYKAIQPTGIDYWTTLHCILQREPVEERDRFYVAWLDNLGIKKGKPFNPTKKQKVLLTAASERGQLMAEVNSFKKRFDKSKHWPDRQWEYVLMMKDPMQRAENFDEFFTRAAYFYEAAGYSKAMVSQTPNIGQAYLSTYTDKDDNWLEGTQNYRLHVPANPPAANFWSITVYDAATRCMIDNPQRNADLSSRKDLVKNSDGSVDIYFSPKAPLSKKTNWIQTIEGRHWFTYFRCYGPTVKYFDKSWKLGDFEKVN